MSQAQWTANQADTDVVMGGRERGAFVTEDKSNWCCLITPVRL